MNAHSNRPLHCLQNWLLNLILQTTDHLAEHSWAPPRQTPKAVSTPGSLRLKLTNIPDLQDDSAKNKQDVTAVRGEATHPHEH